MEGNNTKSYEKKNSILCMKLRFVLFSKCSEVMHVCLQFNFYCSKLLERGENKNWHAIFYSVLCTQIFTARFSYRPRWIFLIGKFQITIIADLRAYIIMVVQLGIYVFTQFHADTRPEIWMFISWLNVITLLCCSNVKICVTHSFDT